MANKYWNLKRHSKESGKGTLGLDTLVSKFKNEGNRLLEKLVENKTYQNRTSNLVSSYAYAMFYGGEIIYTKRVSDTSTSTVHGDMRASEEIDKELQRRLKEADKEKFVFVIFAAMFYGKILESAAAMIDGRNRMVIKDIIREDMEVLNSKVDGKLNSYG